MKLILVLLCVIHTSYSFFDYDKAISKAQKGDCKGASEDLKQLVANTPTSAQLAYDAGVAAYQTEDYESAVKFFSVAAQHASDRQSLLKEQAYFNTGNAHLKRKEWNHAIESYQKVIELNNANERAKHNLEYAKKMKHQEEQKQESNNNQSDQENNKKENEKDQQEDQSDASSQDREKQDQQENAQKNKDQKQQQQEQKQNQPPSQRKQESPKKEKNSSPFAEHKSKGDTEREQQQSQEKGDNNEQSQQQENSSQQSMSEQSRSEKSQSDQSVKHHNSQQNGKNNDSQQKQASNTQSNKGTKKDEQSSASQNNEQGQQQQGDFSKTQKIDKQMQWINQLLEQQEKADEKLNKLLIQSAVDQQDKGASHEEYSW